MKTTTKPMVAAGVFLALGLLLPFLTGQIPSLGSRMLPMHIPVILCGFLCGSRYGLMVGFLTPLLRSLLFGVPFLFPIALTMAFELAVYGAVSGVLYRLLPKKTPFYWIALIGAMIAGRLVWGGVAAILYPLAGVKFGWPIFLAGAFVNAIPGIVIQLFVIPAILLGMRRAGKIQ